MLLSFWNILSLFTNWPTGEIWENPSALLKFHIWLMSSPSAPRSLFPAFVPPEFHLQSTLPAFSDPRFVSVSVDPAGQKLYFFFSEIGKEFSFVDPIQIPRVAQVCKVLETQSSDWWPDGRSEIITLCRFHRTMLEDRGFCRRSGHPLPSLLCSASLQNSLPSTSWRICSPCSHQRAPTPQKHCFMASSPPSGEAPSHSWWRCFYWPG